MNIEGRTIRLRAVEPGDVDLMYEWENDCDIWPVSGTTEPFSRHQLERFVERHQDIVGVLCDGQLRLIIETLLSSKPVGAIDLFEYDPIHRRAGIGILIYEQSDRGRGDAPHAARIGQRGVDVTRIAVGEFHRNALPQEGGVLFGVNDLHAERPQRIAVGIAFERRAAGGQQAG